jgi:hypothetical protein
MWTMSSGQAPAETFRIANLLHEDNVFGCAHASLTVTEGRSGYLATFNSMNKLSKVCHATVHWIVDPITVPAQCKTEEKS